MSVDTIASATWIRPHEEDAPAAGLRPAYELSRDFELAMVPESATMAVTAHGLVEVFLNGVRVGDDELVPGFTSYRKRLQVFSYDIAALLRPGSNRVEALLSDGWFRGRHGFERRPDGFGDETALLLAIEAGNVRVATDAAWQSRASAITRADLMDGQATDFRLVEGDRPWSPVSVAAGGLYDDRDRLVEASDVRVRRIETLAPTAATRPRPGTVVIDVGRDINGWLRIADLGPRNTHLRLTHGEVLDADGLVSMENLRAFVFATGERLPAGQVDDVVSAGREGEVFEPRHTTHGFRYVQIDGVPGGWDAEAVRAVVVHSDLRPAGEFACSDERLDALHDLAVWSLRGNACDIPTDCPQRERSGFTGDWQVFVDTAAMLYDVEAFSAKWLDDLAADQWPDGRVPTVIPNPAGDGPSGVVFEDLSAGSAGWGDAAVLVPWELWRHYGDLEALRRRLPSMRRWVEYAAGAAAGGRHPERSSSRPQAAPHEPYLWDTGFHFGEWLEPGVPPRPDPTADHSIVATAFLHRSAALLAASATVVGDGEVATWAQGIAAGALAAWRAEFVTTPGRLAIESQANYTRGLAFELFASEDRPLAAERLAELIAEAGGHLGTGFLSTGQLLPALADNGQVETAYATLLSTGIPSWLGMLDRGATTAWEWWDAVGDDGAVRGSLNHYSKAAVVSFLYTHVAGIRLDANPDAASAAFRRVRIAPVPGGGLAWARAAIDTPRGPLRSEWRVDDGTFTLEVEIPDSTMATVALPDGARRTVAEGRHAFTASLLNPAARSEEAT
ncbi:family 78 glycoside hydrolase catalytic domain [Microbacterium deminutum]|uniref:alpha-L-rhamnosidase n=1 Tax=Microbacterium deminutum TaxID=344164 RepID=A0ABP5CBR1_9MICO